jgi:hypothetical protein
MPVATVWGVNRTEEDDSNHTSSPRVRRRYKVHVAVTVDVHGHSVNGV